MATPVDAKGASSEREILFRPSLQWQYVNKSPPLYLRRLLLRAPGSRRGRHDRGVETSSSVFGTVLSNLIAHCLLPRAKKCHVFIVIRERLARIARLLSLSSGGDVQFLARGIASAPLVRSQRRLLPELKNTGIDAKYGCVATPVGATAAVICTVALLVSKGTCEWIKSRALLLSALIRAESQLIDWGQAGSWDAEARASLEAERRALARAAKAVEVAIVQSTEQNLGAMESMRLQLAAAEHGAFPPCSIGQNTQAMLTRKIEAREMFAISLEQLEAKPTRGWPTSLTVVPLAALPADGSRVPMGSSSSGSGSLTVVSDTASAVSEAWEDVSVMSESAVVEVAEFEHVSVG